MFGADLFVAVNFSTGFTEGWNQEALVDDIVGAVYGPLKAECQGDFAGQQLELGELGVLLIILSLERVVLTAERIYFRPQGVVIGHLPGHPQVA